MRSECPLREGKSRDSGDERQQEALGDELPDQARPPGPERRSDGKLAAALDASGKEQAGHVRAADAQHEHHRTQHQHERQADAAHQVLAQRDDDGAARGVGPRILFGERGRDRVHLALRLLDGHARREARDDVPPGTGPDALLVFLNDFRHPHDELAGSRQELRRERSRQHAHDRPGFVVHADRLVDDVRVPGIAGLPEAIRDDDCATPAADVLLWQESSADHRSHPDSVEEALSHLRAEQHLRLGPAGVVHGIRDRTRDERERARAVAPIEEICGRHLLALGGTRRGTLPEGDDALGVLIGQGPELERVEERDDRHRAADAERQNQDGRQRERGSFDEHAYAVLHVVHDIGVGGELSAKPGGVGQRA